VKNLTVAVVSMLVTLLGSACTSTQPITEPVAVIEAFHQALSDGDMDAAMNFVADDAEFNFDRVYAGKAEIRELFQESMNLKVQWELTNLNVQDGTVMFDFRGINEFGGGAVDGSTEAVVQNGKIVSMTDL